MITGLKVAALILLGVTMALSLAHALERPGKMRLNREHYLAVQLIYYPGFTYAGAAEPLAIMALAALLALTPAGTSFWLIAGALAATALTHLLYWLLTAPVNRIWLKDEALRAGARGFLGTGKGGEDHDWTMLRDRWERSHVYRAVAAFTAFILLAVAVAD